MFAESVFTFQYFLFLKITKVLMIPLFHLGRDCLINNNDKIKKFLKQTVLLFFVFANAGKFPRPSKSQQTCIGNYWRGESFINV